MLNCKLALLAFAAAVSVGGAVKADTTADFTPKHKGLVLVNVRFTDVIPQDGQPIYLADGTDTTLRTKITDSVVPTLGLTYFVTDNLAVDLIAGTSYHAISAVNRPPTSWSNAPSCCRPPCRCSTTSCQRSGSAPTWALA